MEEGFRGPQVCLLVGISYRQLDYWARTGLLEPSMAPARGSGSRRLYSYRDLVELKVIKRLLDSGIALQAARTAIAFLREHLGEELSTANLVIEGDRTVLARSGEEVIDLLAGGQGVLNIVPLGGVVGELEAAIHELSPDDKSGKAKRAGSPVARGTSGANAGQVSPGVLEGALLQPAGDKCDERLDLELAQPS
ncbi:MAG: MerR family transcriptional regulator [Actinobacteria bacterium]|nr:MerR family transcriptional regulator [Actinomycetota bacterium]